MTVSCGFSRQGHNSESLSMLFTRLAGASSFISWAKTHYLAPKLAIAKCVSLNIQVLGLERFWILTYNRHTKRSGWCLKSKILWPFFDGILRGCWWVWWSSVFMDDKWNGPTASTSPTTNVPDETVIPGIEDSQLAANNVICSTI